MFSPQKRSSWLAPASQLLDKRCYGNACQQLVDVEPLLCIHRALQL
jgi:hypothetical protein